MIRHVLADGRELDSIEGYVVPSTGPTAVVYTILADFSKKAKKEVRKCEKEEKK